MSDTQETINETMQVMHAVPLSLCDDKSKRGPYLRSESGDVCDFYFFSLTEHGQRDKMILHPNAHENAYRLAACWNYCRGIPTAALDGEGVRAAIEEMARALRICRSVFINMSDRGAYPSELAADSDLCMTGGGWIFIDQALSRIDAALAAGEKR